MIVGPARPTVKELPKTSIFRHSKPQDSGRSRTPRISSAVFDSRLSLQGWQMKRTDWVGNGLLMAGTISMLYALAYAGSKYSWSSWHTLVPLFLWLLGILACGTWEARELSADLVMPPRLFKHRTSIIVSIATFLHSILVFWGLYFLPLYFQAVLLFSAERPGVSLLPMSLIALPGAALAAMAVSRWGRFKWLHLTGIAIFTLGIGLFALQRERHLHC